MKLLVLLGALITLASSQCLSSIPECAQQCLTNAVSAATSCGSTDWMCQCTTDHQKVIQQSSRNCIVAACGEAIGFEEVTLAWEAFCSAINAGESCTATATVTTSTTTTESSSSSSSSSSPSVTMTTTTSGTGSSSGTGTSTSTGTGTSTGTAATASSTAGAAGAANFDSWGMLILGALAFV